MYCARCKIVLLSGKFCRFCGEETIKEDFNCPYCKTLNLVTARFCENCGRPIHEYASAVVEERLEGKGGE